MTNKYQILWFQDDLDDNIKSIVGKFEINLKGGKDIHINTLENQFSKNNEQAGAELGQTQP